MPTRRPRKAVRADDGRLKANMPPERRSKVTYRSRWQKLMDGDLKVTDLDDDEIRMGKCKDKNGGFTGRPPAVFPRALHDAMRLEFQRRINEKFQAAVDIAYVTLIDVATSPRSAADARVKAAALLMERGLGKVPDKVFSEIVVKKFEENIEGLFVDVHADDTNVVPIRKVQGA